MKILITGATGMVGKALCDLLLQNGHTVHYLTTSKNKIHTHPRYKGFLWDPNKGEIDEQALSDVDAIVNLAGANISKRWSNAYKQEIIESRVLSLRLLFKALKSNQHQVKHFISASAIGIYQNSLTHVATELDTEFDDSFLGQVVEKWEENIDKFKLLNIKVSKLRLGMVLSNEGGVLKALTPSIKIGLGSPIGSGKQFQSWIHIQDLVNMFYFLLIEEFEGTYNAVSPYPVTNKKMVQEIAKNYNRPIFLPAIPKFILKLILGQMHEMLVSSQNVSCKKIISEGFQFKYPTIEKALKNLI